LSSFVHFHAWSPDGKAIFYIHRSRGEKYVDRILSRNLETGEERELWRGEMVLEFPYLLPSPDGRQLAACSRESLRIVPAGGGELRELLKAQGAERLWLVSWTPDGRYLLFTKTLRGAAELWRIAAEGGQPERLAPLPRPLNGELRLHPDGQRVAFTGGEDKFEVWVLENFLPPPKAAKQ
jgi:TolB protein